MTLWSIAAVERDTGLSKDTLRIWERRYGFPEPARDALGERLYPAEQVERLRLVKRLLDGGHRPRGVVALDLPALQALAPQAGTARRSVPSLSAGAAEPSSQPLHFELVLQHAPHALRQALARDLSRLGLARFIAEVASPLTVTVGEEWLQGRLQIFEEHLFTEVLQGVLRQAINALPVPEPVSRPRVLLATLPGEPHALGLLMAEALLSLDGADCISLGSQAPLWDVHLAAAAVQADAVLLGFTGCNGPGAVLANLTELRAKLPGHVALWAGGNVPVLQRRQLSGVEPLSSFAALAGAVQRWRNRLVAEPSSLE